MILNVVIRYQSLGSRGRRPMSSIKVLPLSHSYTDTLYGCRYRTDMLCWSA